MRSTVVVAVLGIFAAGAAAQPPVERSPFPFIRTTGEGVVSARPDQARIAIGVIAQAPQAQAAAEQNATRADAVLRELRRAAGSGSEIATAGYSLEPDYRQPRPGGSPEIAGYTARSTIRVVTADLASVGKLIDAAMQAGANNVERLQFTLKDQRAARSQALREAAANARADAEAIAAALGLKIQRVFSAEEAGGPQPMRSMEVSSFARIPAPSTPIEAGNLDVRATVSLRVEVGP